MMSYRTQTPLQKVVTAFILVLFLATVFFSFASMMHGEEAGMRADCPFSVMGEPLCPQNLAAAIMHHISAYQSFLAVFAGSGMTAVVIAFLLAFSAALSFLISPLLYKPPELTRTFFIPPPAVRKDRKEIRWLSLFENSPSLI